MASKMAKCDVDTSLGGYVDAGFQKKEHIQSSVFFLLYIENG